MPADQNLNALVERYAGIEGRHLIRNVARDFSGRIAVLSSFGTESAVLLHMVSEVAPNLPVIFLDTEKLFPETLAYRDQLVSEFGLTNLKIWKPDQLDLLDEDPSGDLHQSSTDRCCHIRKTLPMERALSNFDVVISGRKRYHGATRQDLEFVSHQNGRLKVEPLAGFSALDLQNYMQAYHLPSHPLKLQGYRSIGCIPCTSLGGTDDNPRAGRWMGTEKTECGIHISHNGQDIRNIERSSASA